MKPLQFGADIVYDSGTKFLSGHHDLMAGLVICNDDKIAGQLAFIINSIGNGLAPFECFLLTRGIKTLSLRLDRQQATATHVAKHLDRWGFKVNYPGLPKHKGKHIHDRLAKGPGAVLSFETGDKRLSEKIVSLTRLWAISVSFGCVNSLISMPCLMSHASIDPAVRAARNLPEDLIRLCVGIEDPEDLLQDLQSALLEAGAIRILDETAVDSGFERVKLNDPVTPSAEQMVQYAKPFGFLKNPATVLVSAPGKIILFGEHAVVFGKKAIAAAVDLRCYCFVEPNLNQIETVTLCLPDSHWIASWFLDELPWDSLPPINETGELSVDPQLSNVLRSKASAKSDKGSLVQAAHAFLYLFMTLARNQSRRSQVFTVRSTLPIGAGLGSSASYSVALASALLYSHQHIGLPTEKKIDKKDLETVNRWAFLGEKILHGSPSGVDNTVSSFGGAICFRKEVNRSVEDPAEKKSIEQINGFGALRILITDTQVPRDTKSLVAGVAKRKKEEPDYIQKILDEIESITTEARELILKSNTTHQHPDGSSDRDENQKSPKQRTETIQRLGELMNANHLLLSSLGVSHEKLEVVKRIATTYRSKQDGSTGLQTKLTGAGGGGCAISLLPDDIDEGSLESIIVELEASKMKTYETQVGVPGLGLLNGFDGDHHQGDYSLIKNIYMTSSLTELNQALLNKSPSHACSDNSSKSKSDGRLFWSFA